MKNKKRIYSILIILLFVLILICQYLNNINTFKKPPSENWSKEVTVGNGNCRNNPILIKDKDNLIIGYDNGNELKLSVTDKLGKVILEKSYDIKENFIMGLALLKWKDGYVFNYMSSEDGNGYIESLVLDKNYNKIDEKKVTNIKAMKQLSDNLLLIGYKDKLELINTETAHKEFIPANNISMVASTKIKEGYFITLLENNELIKVCYVKDGKFSGERNIISMIKMSNASYSNLACSLDDKFGYVLLEERSKGVFVGTKVIQFELKGNEVKDYTLEVNGNNNVYYNTGVYSENGARFLATTTRKLNKNNVQENIIDYTINNGKVEKFEYATRLRDLNIYPYANEDMMVFISFNEKDNYSVNLASTNEGFKNANNVSRKIEYKQALISSVEGVMFSLAYLFIYALMWIIPSIVLVGLFSFFDYKLNKSKKLKIFLVCAVFTTLVKIIAINSVIYGRYIEMLPQFISSKVIGILILSIISLLCYGFGYERFKKEPENIILFPFGISLILDSLLTLLVFIPFII